VLQWVVIVARVIGFVLTIVAGILANVALFIFGFIGALMRGSRGR